MRGTVRTALFAALAAALGFLLAPLPNIELMTFSIFAAGYVLGFARGCAAGALAALIFFGLNPYGSSFMFPPLFLAQILACCFIACLGSAYGRICPYGRRGRWLRLACLMPFAATASLCLTVLPTLGFAWFGGGSWRGWLALGVFMTAWGFIFNMLIFAGSFDALARQSVRQASGRLAQASCAGKEGRLEC